LAQVGSKARIAAEEEIHRAGGGEKTYSLDNYHPSWGNRDCPGGSDAMSR
jgi:hypothetical protein